MFLPEFKPVIRNGDPSASNKDPEAPSHTLTERSLVARGQADLPPTLGPPSGSPTGPSVALIIGIMCGVLLMIAIGGTVAVQIQKRRRKAQDMPSLNQPGVIKYTKELEKHTDSMRPIPIGQHILPSHPQASYSVSSFSSFQSHPSMDDTKSTASLIPEVFEMRLEDAHIVTKNDIRRGYSDRIQLNFPASIKPDIHGKSHVQVNNQIPDTATSPSLPQDMVRNTNPDAASSGVDPFPPPRRRVGLPSTPSPRASRFAQMQQHSQQVRNA